MQYMKNIGPTKMIVFSETLTEECTQKVPITGWNICFMKAMIGINVFNSWCCAMDHRFKKVGIRIKGIFVPILNFYLRQIEKMREGFEILWKSSQRSDISKVFETIKIVMSWQGITDSGFFMKRYFKRPSLIEEGDTITVTNIHFYDIEDSGKE